MRRPRGPEHSAAIKRGLARRKETFEQDEPLRAPCYHCGKLFPYETYTGPWRRYCSNACRQAAYRERR